MPWSIFKEASKKPSICSATKSSRLVIRLVAALNLMQVPILKQRDYLIASVQSVLSDEDLLRLRDELATRVGRNRSKGVIIDVTVMDVIDSFATRTLRAIAHMVRLRGAETVIVGIQPELAFSMVQLG